MSICEYCNGEVALPFTCRRCGKLFCPEHKIPESHNCIELEKVRIPRNIEEKKCSNCGGTGWVKVTSHIYKKVEYKKCPYCTTAKKPEEVITLIPEKEIEEKRSEVFVGCHKCAYASTSSDIEPCKSCQREDFKYYHPVRESPSCGDWITEHVDVELGLLVVGIIFGVAFVSLIILPQSIAW